MSENSNAHPESGMTALFVRRPILAFVLNTLIVVAGLAVFVAIGVVLLVATLGRLLAGDRAGASRMIGTRSAQEEVEEELRAAEARDAAALGK